MRFAFCVFTYFPFGGLERNCLRMAEIARDRGHDVNIYCLEWGDDFPHGINVIEMKVGGFTNHGRAKRFSSAVNKLLKEQRYEVVVGFNRMPGLDLFYAADVCYEHDVRERHGFFYRLLPRYKVYSAFEKAVFDRSSTTEILSIVDTETQYCIKHYGTQPERFHDIPPGIYKDRMAPDDVSDIRSAIRVQLGVSDEAFVILCIGSDFKRKGLMRTINAMSSLPDAIAANTHIWVIGKDDASAYQDAAKNLGLAKRVHFLGARKDIPALLFSGDMLCHPAIKEATGGVLLESLAAGLPVVASGVCGFAFHIRDADAGVVLQEPFDQGELDRALIKMITSPDRNQWHNNALKYGREEDLYSRADKAVDIMEVIAKRKKS